MNRHEKSRPARGGSNGSVPNQGRNKHNSFRSANNSRSRFPAPEAYYRTHVRRLSAVGVDGWASGICPFHDDHNPSLGVQLNDGRGAWWCFAGCGGGDLISFHMRLFGMTFKAACRDLLGGCDEYY